MQRFCKPQSSAQARKEAPIYSNGDVSITGLMPQIVSLADAGSNPVVHPTLMHDDGASELRCLQNIIV